MERGQLHLTHSGRERHVRPPLILFRARRAESRQVPRRIRLRRRRWRRGFGLRLAPPSVHVAKLHLWRRGYGYG